MSSFGLGGGCVSLAVGAARAHFLPANCSDTVNTRLPNKRFPLFRFDDAIKQGLYDFGGGLPGLLFNLLSDSLRIPGGG